MRMPRRLAGLVAAVAGALLLVPSLAGANEPTDAEKAYAKALEQARKIEGDLMEAVDEVRLNSVSVLNMRKPPNSDTLVMGGVGSGVLVRYKGKLWILTNEHVIEGAQGLEIVTHDGERHHVEHVDSIRTYDIALLKFRDKVRGYRGVTLKASASDDRKLKEGTWVIATGNPFFLAVDGRSVTTLGVISGLDRYLGGRFNYEGAIQHDAEVNPGNSGGPLWNLKGELLGINGMIMMGQRLRGAGPSNTGASFSLTVAQVAGFMKRLVDDKDAQAAFLGVSAETNTDSRGRARGARVTRIDRRSPLRGARADKAPQVGDVITVLTISGRTTKIYDATDIRRAVSTHVAGAKISITFKRGSKTLRWKGVLGGAQ